VRTATAGELTLLASATANHYTRVEVQNGSGTWKDLTALGGVDWVDAWEIDGEMIDRPVATAKLELRRDITGSTSLSPLMAASSLNVNDVAVYAPLLDVGRAVRITTAVTASGVAPVPGDWKEMFLGRINAISWETSPVAVDCSDRFAWVVDRYIETEASVGSNSGASLESVLAQILTAWPPVGGAPTISTPASPGWTIPLAFLTAKKSVAEELKDLVDQIAWEFRYRYDASDVSRLTLFQPPRGTSTSLATISPTVYRAVHKLNLAIDDIRNAVKVNGVTGGVANAALSTDATSISAYGRRYMELPANPVLTPTQMQALADAAVVDLKAAKAEQEVELLYYWPAQLYDLFTFPANGDHYDSAQVLAVIGVKHAGKNGEIVTTLTCRGAVAGAYAGWLSRSTTILPSLTTPQLAPFAHVDNATTVVFTWTRNIPTNAVWVYDSLLNVGDADPYALGTAVPTVLTSANTYTASVPAQGKVRRLHFAAVDLNGVAGTVIDFEVYPPNTMAPVGQPRAVFNTNRDAVDVYVALTSPASETITASFRDSEAAGAPVYALCVSGSDATPLYFASGTEIGPTNWFTYGGTQTQRLAAIALSRDQIKRLYFLLTGKPSGSQATAHIALPMKEQPWLESIAATWNAATGNYDVVLVGGANCLSANIEIADNAAFTSPTAYSAALADGGSLSHSFALSGTQLGKLWYARGTPYNAVTLGGLAGTPQQDSDYIPANPGLAILAVQATPAGGPYTGISIPFTFSSMPSGVTFDVSYDNGGGNIDSSTGNTASPVTFTPGVVFNAVGGAPGKGSITITAQGPAGTIKTATRYKPYLL
jgi:hypothetical protein